MKIEIKGVQFKNIGAQLMLLAVVDAIRQRNPEAEIVLSAHANSPYVQRIALGCWQKLNLRRGPIDLNRFSGHLPRRALGWLNRFGLVPEAQIDVILDASGFAYGDDWPRRNLQYARAEARRFAASGRKYVFLPQAFGPFSSTTDQALAAAMVAAAAAVYVRDPVSMDALRACGCAAAQLRPGPDFTATVAAAAVNTDPAGPYALLIPSAEFVRRGAMPVPDYQACFARLSAALRAQGLAVLLLNHGGDADALLCRQFAAAGIGRYAGTPAARACKALIGGARAVVSSRFHGCVSALSQGVPCLATAWSHKYQALMAEYDQQDMCLSLTPADDVAANVAALLDPERLEALRTSPAHRRIADDIEQMWAQIFELTGL